MQTGRCFRFYPPSGWALEARISDHIPTIEEQPARIRHLGSWTGLNRNLSVMRRTGMIRIVRTALSWTMAA